MTQSDKILREREKNGLIISIAIRMILLVFITIGHLISHHSPGELLRVSLATSFFLLLLLFFLFLLKRDQYLSQIGFLSLIVDAFLLCFLPYNWYVSVGYYENVPAVYLLKTSLPAMGFVFVCVSSLAIRPAYPIINAFVFNAIWAFFFYLVIQDPRTVYTESFTENFFSEKILLNYYIMFPVTITGAAMMIALVANSYRKSIREAVSLEVANSQMSRYFSPGILNEIQNDESLFKAKKTNIVVMFVDIRGFTSMSDAMNPEDVVSFLREYHSIMVEIIYSYSGTIDKFLGDGIMVSFGTPLPDEMDSVRALQCAIKMREKLKSWNEKRIQNKKNPIQQGIGIHFGEVVSGNIGSESRLEYTVIGDTVNIASRIESQCKIAQEDILISGSLCKKINSVHANMDDSHDRKDNVGRLINRLESIGGVEIRGKKEKIELFKIL